MARSERRYLLTLTSGEGGPYRFSLRDTEDGSLLTFDLIAELASFLEAQLPPDASQVDSTSTTTDTDGGEHA